jgi:hypothetical protein
MGVAMPQRGTESRSATTASVFLAGLQAGMIAVWWMLAWMGVSAKWQSRGFWTSENLMASVFYGDAAIRLGFAFSTISGLALYLILYSLLGALLATALRSRLTGLGTLLVSILFALGWYYFFFHAIGKTVMPLVTLLHSERPTVFGHVIYGGLVARFHSFLPRLEQPAAPEKTAG